MKRFQYTRSESSVPKVFIFLAICAVVIGVFTSSVNSFSRDNRQRQEQILSSALNRRITHCYATNGTYPRGLDYIKENYGLTYDENKFFVDYHISGANIYPDVTIIQKGD